MATLMSEMCRAASANELTTLIADSIQQWSSKGYSKKAEVKSGGNGAGMGYLRTTPAAHPALEIDEPAALLTAILILEKS